MLTAEHKIIIVHLLPAGFAERYKRHVDKIEKIWPEWFQLGSQERSGIRALTFVKYSKLNTVNFVTVTRVGIWHQLQGDQYCEDQQQAKSHAEWSKTSEKLSLSANVQGKARKAKERRHTLFKKSDLLIGNKRATWKRCLDNFGCEQKRFGRAEQTIDKLFISATTTAL
ncbi:hypothetical protein T4E_12217 [Trichinella pseudospiralis]|uniref:Uncharacterized protein n=1 Tax=Trichinella pseudospiralis TaxID=6337 RepID=A0A0V0YDJ4_TRIPS|nr:hypothetical protein T4E_12217 [Trichinella pseudospiralis]